MDLSGPYRATFDTMLPHAIQVADRFHVVKNANLRLDECRRRVHNETLGHRGHKTDPLYRCRRLLLKAHERLDGRGDDKLAGLLRAGDPRGEVAYAWHAKQAVRFLYDIANPTMAAAYVDDLPHDLQDGEFPPEVRALGPLCTGGETQSSPGTSAAHPTAPPRPSTIWSSERSAEHSASDASATTRSGPCSTPTSPTETHSRRSHPREIRSARQTITANQAATH